MERDYNRLCDIINQVETLLINSTTDPILEKQREDYPNGTKLLDEATDIINKLSNDIQNLHLIKGDNIYHIENLVVALSIPNIDFNEAYRATEQLCKIHNNLPIRAHFSEHSILD